MHDFKKHLYDVLKAAIAAAAVAFIQAMVPDITEMLAHPATQATAMIGAGFAAIKTTKVA